MRQTRGEKIKWSFKYTIKYRKLDAYVDEPMGENIPHSRNQNMNMSANVFCLIMIRLALPEHGSVWLVSDLACNPQPHTQTHTEGLRETHGDINRERYTPALTYISILLGCSHLPHHFSSTPAPSFFPLFITSRSLTPTFVDLPLWDSPTPSPLAPLLLPSPLSYPSSSHLLFDVMIRGYLGLLSKGKR